LAGTRKKKFVISPGREKKSSFLVERGKEILSQEGRAAATAEGKKGCLYVQEVKRKELTG